MSGFIVKHLRRTHHEMLGDSKHLAKEMTLIPDEKNKDTCLNCPLARCVNKCGRVSGALR